MASKDSKKLAPILTEVCVITPSISLGVVLSHHILKLIRKKTHKKNKKPLAMMCQEIESVTEHFEKVPKSRLAEIVIATGIPKERIQALLKFGPFDHEPSCFWKFAESASSTMV